MTTRRQFLRTSLGAGSVLAAGDLSLQAAEHDGLQRIVKRGKALGTQVSITALHSNRELAERGANSAFDELRLVERLMSVYRSDSQLGRLNQQGELASPHAYLLEVLRCAKRVARLSNGAFDITVQPLWRLYDDARREGREPTTAEVATAANQVDWRQVRCDKSTVTIQKPARSVTLNGIAQGFAADRAKNALAKAGVRHALIDTGELSCLGNKAAGGAWTAGVQHPRRPDAFAAVLPLGDRSLATSGDYATTFSEDRRLHHLFDPKTGGSPQIYSSVSVLAPTAMEADALSTALFAMDVESGRRLLGKFPRTDAMLILKSGRTIATRGFPGAPS